MSAYDHAVLTPLAVGRGEDYVGCDEGATAKVSEVVLYGHGIGKASAGCLYRGLRSWQSNIYISKLHHLLLANIQFVKRQGIMN